MEDSKFTPVAMIYNQEDIEQIKKELGHLFDPFFQHGQLRKEFPYITNFYLQEKNRIDNVSSFYAESLEELKVHKIIEPNRPDLFIKACNEGLTINKMDKQKEPEKNYDSIKRGSLIFFLTYCTHSFVLNTPDASQWTNENRAVMILIFLTFFLMDYISFHIKKAL